MASLWQKTKPSNSALSAAAALKVESVAASPSSHGYSQTGSIWELQTRISVSRGVMKSP